MPDLQTNDKPEQAQAPAQAPAQKKTAPRKGSKKKLVKRIIALVVTLAILAGIGYGMWYLVFREEEALGEIYAEPAFRGSIQSSVQGSGYATAKDNATVTVPYDGVIDQLLVGPNETVYAGQPLFDMSSPAAQAAVEKAQQDLAAARDGVVKAQQGVTDAERNVPKVEKGIAAAEKQVAEAEKQIPAAEKRVAAAEKQVTEAEKEVTAREKAVVTAQQGVAKAQEGVVKAQEGVTKAQEELRAREQDLADLRLRTSWLTITAPFSGKIVKVHGHAVGDKLRAGDSLATLVNDKQLRVTLYFSYAYEDQIQTGQSAQISVPAMMLTTTGKVETIYKINHISPEGGTYFQAVLAFDNPGTLTEGMNATATLTARDGSPIYPYNSGTTEYYETREIITSLDGPLTSIYLAADLDVTAGQTLAVLGPDDLNEDIKAKEKEIESAKQAIEDAKQGVETAKQGVEDAKQGVEDAKQGVEDARQAVETAKEGVEAAKEGVETAREGVTAAREGVTAAQEGVTAAYEAVEDARRQIGVAEEAVVEAQKRVTEAEEALAKAEEDVGNLNATAPIDGTIMSCTIEEGSEVKGGSAVITISNTTTMVVTIQVDSRNIGFISLGSTIELSDWYGNYYMGTVTNIDYNVVGGGEGGMGGMGGYGSSSSGFPVTLEVDNYSGELFSGYELSYSFVTSQSEDCILVQTIAVKSVADTEGNRQTVVFIERPERPDNAIDLDYSTLTGVPTPEEGFWPVLVETGLSDARQVEIKSGIEEMDNVFISYTDPDRASGMGGVFYG